MKAPSPWFTGDDYAGVYTWQLPGGGFPLPPLQAEDLQIH